MNGYTVSALSRLQIRRMAEAIRKIDGSEQQLYFDIVKFVELKLPKIDPSFNFNVGAMSKMGDCHGLTYPERNEINIREDVYEKAYNGSGRDRLTIAHELFHLLQHTSDNVCFARNGSAETPAYRNPEWQANAFGGELLIPHKLINGLSVNEIMVQCGVSADAARYQRRLP